jgi:hypothetical protein
VLSALGALLVAGMVLLACPLTTPPRVVSASDLVGRLASGQGVNEVDVVVQGELDLRPLGTVALPFRCRGCTFSGTVDATDVVFQRVVDLSGSIVRGALLLTGAQFRGPFLLDETPGRRSEIHGPANLQLATFSDVASADGARVLGPADFTSAQFLRGASFAETEFGAEALFDRAQFGAATSFADGSSRGLSMGRATFAGPAVFRQHTFHADADFTGTAFQGPVNFTLAEFERKALFDSVSFDRGATFRLVSAASGSFRSAQARGPLIFDGAVFVQGVSLAELSVTDLLSLRSIHVVANNGLELDQLAAATLLLDVPTVDQVRGIAVQQEMLGLLEKSAEAAGDLPLANDARFQRLTSEASRSGPAYQVFDRVVLREIGGYLVRPLYPLRAMLLVLILGITIRTVPTWWRNPSLPLARGRRRRPRPTAGGESNMQVLVRALWVSGHQIVAKSPGVEWDNEEAPSGRTAALWGEYLAHKILIVLFVLSLGNSNPTVRQIIDAIVRG